MEKICPACNKIKKLNIKCKNCATEMIDEGRAQETMLDDYTANMPINDNCNYCIHVFKCINCGRSERIEIVKIKV